MKGGFYRKLAAYGHVGRMDIGLPWELTDKAQLLKSVDNSVSAGSEVTSR